MATHATQPSRAATERKAKELCVVVTGENDEITIVRDESIEIASVEACDLVYMSAKNQQVGLNSHYKNKTITIIPCAKMHSPPLVHVKEVVKVPYNSRVKIIKGHSKSKSTKIYQIVKKLQLHKELKRHKKEIAAMLGKRLVGVLTGGRDCEELRRHYAPNEATTTEFMQIVHMKASGNLDKIESKNVNWATFKQNVDTEMAEDSNWKGFEEEAENYWGIEDISFGKHKIFQYKCKSGKKESGETSK